MDMGKAWEAVCRASEVGRRTKSYDTWSGEPQKAGEPASSQRASQPSLPQPLHILLGLRGLQHGFESPEKGGERGQNPTTCNGGFSSPHRMGL